MPVKDDKVRTLITLTKEDKEQLENLAKIDNRSLSSYISTVLKKHLEEVSNTIPLLIGEAPTTYSYNKEQEIPKEQLDMLKQIIKSCEDIILDNVYERMMAEVSNSTIKHK